MPTTRREFLKGIGGIGAALAFSPANVFGSAAESSPSLEERLRIEYEPEIMKFIEENKGYITESAKKYDLPPEFLASVLYIEKTSDTWLDRAKDHLQILFGRDPTLGDGQIRISTAAGLDGKNYKKLTSDERQKYRELILEPKSNIDYVAKYLSSLIRRSNRYPIITSEELLRNPKAMAIAGTEYSTGPRKSPVEKAKFNLRGLAVIARLQDGSPFYSIFGRTDKGKIVRDYIKSNMDLVKEADKNYEIEDSNYLRKRLGLAILGIATLGGAAWAYATSKEKRGYKIKPQV